jgi:filamentous hemagglutinin
VTYRLQTFLTGLLALLTVALLALAPVTANPTSRGYQLFERAASGISADIRLGSLENFAPPPETASEYSNAPNTGTGARFADQAKLDDHFIRHGTDFGATSSAQYQQMADNFLTGPRGTNTLERIRPNGDVVRYDPTTDAFGVVSSNGTVRTYYVPDPAVHGYATNLDYFNAQ